MSVEYLTWTVNVFVDQIIVAELIYWDETQEGNIMNGLESNGKRTVYEAERTEDDQVLHST